jgi:hypothetical protein
MEPRHDRPAARGPASSGSTYGSGERVFGPPRGTFDVEWVAREIDRCTGAGYPSAHDWVATAWEHARRTTSVHQDGIREAVLASGAPRAAADLVARHVAAYCEAYDVDPAG